MDPNRRFYMPNTSRPPNRRVVIGLRPERRPVVNFILPGQDPNHPEQAAAEINANVGRRGPIQITVEAEIRRDVPQENIQEVNQGNPVMDEFQPPNLVPPMVDEQNNEHEPYYQEPVLNQNQNPQRDAPAGDQLAPKRARMQPTQQDMALNLNLRDNVGNPRAGPLAQEPQQQQPMNVEANRPYNYIQHRSGVLYGPAHDPDSRAARMAVSLVSGLHRMLEPIGPYENYRFDEAGPSNRNQYHPAIADGQGPGMQAFRGPPIHEQHQRQMLNNQPLPAQPMHVRPQVQPELELLHHMHQHDETYRRLMSMQPRPVEIQHPGYDNDDMLEDGQEEDEVQEEDNGQEEDNMQEEYNLQEEYNMQEEDNMQEDEANQLQLLEEVTHIGDAIAEPPIPAGPQGQADEDDVILIPQPQEQVAQVGDNAAEPPIPAEPQGVAENGNVQEVKVADAAVPGSSDGQTASGDIVSKGKKTRPKKGKPAKGESNGEVRQRSHGSLLNEKILNMFECPVCLDYISPPIHQCHQGHLVCHTCWGLLKNVCPTCRTPFAENRNLVLERITEMLLFPCRHHECTQSFKLKRKTLHELNCPWRIYKCEVTNCRWTGLHHSLLRHVQNQHAEVVLNGPHQILSILVDCLFQHTFMIMALGELFCLIVLRNRHINRMVFAGVFYMGPIARAADYSYTIKVETPDSSGFTRAYSYSRTTHCNHLITPNYILDSDAFSISPPLLRHFTENHRIPLQVKIEHRRRQTL